MDVLDKGFEDGVARQEEQRRQQQRLLDVLKEGMKRLVWLTKIRGTEGDDPLWEELKEKLGAIYQSLLFQAMEWSMFCPTPSASE